MKNKITWLGFLLLLAGNYLFGQDNAIQKEIDEQVWLPFIKTFNAFDGEGFNALHTKDVLRAALGHPGW
ncbi:MAG: hypothetical protein IPJ74_13890 [Saprospiraceae bacterium]|nr:hypothetical protein [Saprospiraceae bacterium]